MAVPAGVCSKYLADKKSCYGSCGKLHERWGNIIRKANEGKLKISPAKDSQRTHKPVKVTVTVVAKAAKVKQEGAKPQQNLDLTPAPAVAR